MPRPGSSPSVIVPSRDVGDRTAEQVAQRIVVGVDFQQAVAADARQQMRRCQQTDAAAEIMRAERLAGLDDVARDAGADAQPAPFGDIGLNDPQHIAAERLLEAGAAGDVFAGRKRQSMPLRRRLPFLPRPVGADRLLQPGEIEFGELRRDLQRLRRSTSPDWRRRPACRCRRVGEATRGWRGRPRDRNRSSVSARDGPVPIAASAICREPVGLMPLA